ncbi:helix-turn-helix transcriptional regulator [Mycobacterium sp. ML4]
MNRFTRIRPGYHHAVAGAVKRRGGAAPPVAETPDRSWTFLTNHAHVLLCISAGEPLTARELALRVGITERSVQAIVTDLTAEGYLVKSKVGRRNVYEVNPDGKLRHPLEASHTVGELVAALT